MLSEHSEGATFQKGKPVELLDAKRIGDMVRIQNGLANNVPGSMINGAALKSPVPIYVNDHKADTRQLIGKPDMHEMDLMFKSFRPGMQETERYKLQDTSKFYKTAFPSSAYSGRINSITTRMASADPANRRNNDSKNSRSS